MRAGRGQRRRLRAVPAKKRRGGRTADLDREGPGRPPAWGRGAAAGGDREKPRAEAGAGRTSFFPLIERV